MRVKTELSERPPVFTVDRTENRAVITFYTDVEHLQRDEGEAWSAIAWTSECSWSDNIAERIAAAPDLWFGAVSNDCYNTAAKEVREKRDKLLQESDAKIALDRLGLVVPSGSTFTAWLSFLRGLGNVLSGEIAVYRQALRDLPEQAGFPYDVQWPKE
jgi:hypothetical protein